MAAADAGGGSAGVARRRRLGSVRRKEEVTS